MDRHSEGYESADHASCRGDRKIPQDRRRVNSIVRFRHGNRTHDSRNGECVRIPETTGSEKAPPRHGRNDHGQHQRWARRSSGRLRWGPTLIGCTPVGQMIPRSSSTLVSRMGRGLQDFPTAWSNPFRRDDGGNEMSRATLTAGNAGSHRLPRDAFVTIAVLLLVFAAFDDITTDDATSFPLEYTILDCFCGLAALRGCASHASRGRPARRHFIAGIGRRGVGPARRRSWRRLAPARRRVQAGICGSDERLRVVLDTGACHALAGLARGPPMEKLTSSPE